MTPTVRVFGSEEAAQAVADRLAEGNFGQQRALLAGDLEGREEAAVRSAAADGLVPNGHISTCIGHLKEGRSLVAARIYFGRGHQALLLMESGGAIDSDSLPPLSNRDPSPFSHLIGMPTLTAYVPMGSLVSSNSSFSWLFGLGMLSNKAAPLSSLFGMRTLSRPKHAWTSSFAMPLLSNKAAPLSSLFAMKTLSTAKRGRTRSFGLPMLSRNPAPLSSLFGFQVLSKDK